MKHKYNKRSSGDSDKRYGFPATHYFLNNEGRQVSVNSVQ